MGLPIQFEVSRRWIDHGRVGVAKNQAHLTHEDGTPFLFLADTAWNGPLLSSDADWRAYLSDRAAKGFTAVQFIMMAPWAGAYADADGRTAFDPSDPSRIHHDFFDRLDARVDAINAAGMLAVPVLAWAANFGDSGKHNPGHALGASALGKLIRYQVDRYAARHVLWLLAGDGRYGGLRAWRWKKLGRRIFGDGLPRSPVGLHPMGMTWPYAAFRRESWLDVLGYQSSHSTDSKTLDWLLDGPPSRLRGKDSRPAINLEPCYEGIVDGRSRRTITDSDVRRATYASLLNAPTAGVSYGAHGVWNWATEPREPLNHPGTGIARPWHEAIGFPGSHDVRRLAEFLKSIDYWRLRPANELLDPPRARDAAHRISIATTDASDLLLAYLPLGGAIELKYAAEDRESEWFNPRTGDRIPASWPYVAPSVEDWVLLIQRGNR